MSDNLNTLKNMIYSGRGIIIGMTRSGNEFIGYSLTGRSPSSQARKLVQEEKTKTIRTDVTDKEQLEKGSPALLLYPAIIPIRNNIRDTLIVSNGAQTNLLYTTVIDNKFINNPRDILTEAFSKPFFLYDQKEDRYIDLTIFEPDFPNNTPRISACLLSKKGAFHIVKHKNERKEKNYYTIELEPGKARLITTYKGGNEKPLLPFEDAPLEASIESETAKDITESIYDAIYGGSKSGDNYRVSSAVMLRNQKTKELETFIINRSERGE